MIDEEENMREWITEQHDALEEPLLIESGPAVFLMITLLCLGLLALWMCGVALGWWHL